MNKRKALQTPPVIFAVICDDGKIKTDSRDGYYVFLTEQHAETERDTLNNGYKLTIPPELMRPGDCACKKHRVIKYKLV